MKKGLKKRSFKQLTFARDLLKPWVSWFLHDHLSYPSHAQLIITNKCNSRCTHCTIWKKYREHPELQENELSLEELSRIADELKEIKISTVSISGGGAFYER